MSGEIAVFVATHKPIEVKLPKPYIPVQVNCANTGIHWEGYKYDDSGENISSKNPYYSELTVLYWAWKNSDARVKGLAHYRRFMSKASEVSFLAREYCDLDHLEDYILAKNEITRYIDGEGYDALLIMPQRPYPLTGREELEKFVYKKDIVAMEAVIHKRYPDYDDALKKVMQSQHLSYFNMFIAKAEVFDGYCEWLFDILNGVEECTNVSDYDTQHKRLYGYLSEVLQNVYFGKKGVRCKYLDLSQPYQTMGVDQAAFLKIQHKSECFVFLRKHHLEWMEKNYYRFFHSELYKKYSSCKKYLAEGEDNA